MYDRKIGPKTNTTVLSTATAAASATTTNRKIYQNHHQTNFKRFPPTHSFTWLLPEDDKEEGETENTRVGDGVRGGGQTTEDCEPFFVLENMALMHNNRWNFYSSSWDVSVRTAIAAAATAFRRPMWFPLNRTYTLLIAFFFFLVAIVHVNDASCPWCAYDTLHNFFFIFVHCNNLEVESAFFGSSVGGRIETAFYTLCWW